MNVSHSKAHTHDRVFVYIHTPPEGRLLQIAPLRQG